jgi:hypothetical protein
MTHNSTHLEGRVIDRDYRPFQVRPSHVSLGTWQFDENHAKAPATATSTASFSSPCLP